MRNSILLFEKKQANKQNSFRLQLNKNQIEASYLSNISLVPLLFKGICGNMLPIVLNLMWLLILEVFIVGAECSEHLVESLGMESRFIRNEQITASSRYSGYPPWHGRLNNVNFMFWATAEENPSDQQWIQVDFLDSTTTGNNVIITGIHTQGSGYLGGVKKRVAFIYRFFKDQL